MQELISVIVPVYNVEKYLPKCLDSIIRQTYKKLEIILVDDGSPDNCPQICDEYAKKDKRIKVIHQPNGGLSMARNAGLKIATGEYIGFIDSDDFIEPDMYEYLLKGIKEHEADISTCTFYLEKKEEFYVRYWASHIIYNRLGALDALERLKINNYAWNKLYKKSLWDGIEFPAGKNYEDALTLYKVFNKTKKTVCLPEAKYYYRCNQNGIMNNKSLFNKIDFVYARMEKFDDLKECGILDELPMETRRILYNELFNHRIKISPLLAKASPKKRHEQRTNINAMNDFYKRHFKEICSLSKRPLKIIAIAMLRNSNRFSDFIMTIGVKLYYQYKNLKKAKFKKILNSLRTKAKYSLYHRVYSHLPIHQNWVFIESRGGDDFAGNMFYLAKEIIKDKKFKIFVCATSKNYDKVKNLVSLLGKTNITLVTKFSKKHYKTFASSKYLFNDMVYFSLLHKRKGQVWTNTWHGSQLKTLDYDVIPQRHEIGGGQRELIRTDYLITPNELMAQKLLSSTNATNLAFSTKILHLGYPRNSVFLDAENNSEIRSKYNIEDKEVFVYMPTWRGTFNVHTSTSGEYDALNIMDFFEKSLKENQIMYVKLHNFALKTINFDIYKKLRPFPVDIEPYAFLSATDCLITDYSSVFFDFANTEKKIILFAYDKEEYLRTHGMYLDFDKLPFAKAENYKELKSQLNLKKKYDDSDFIKEYCAYDCKNSAERIVNFVMKGTKEEIFRPELNGKKNILVYDTDYRKRPLESEEVYEFFKKLPLHENNYYYSYPQNMFKTQQQILTNLPEGVQLYAMAPLVIPSISKRYWYHTSPSRVKRELLRNFSSVETVDDILFIGNNKFDERFKILKKIQKQLKRKENKQNSELSQ